MQHHRGCITPSDGISIKGSIRVPAVSTYVKSSRLLVSIVKLTSININDYASVKLTIAWNIYNWSVPLWTCMTLCRGTCFFMFLRFFHFPVLRTIRAYSLSHTLDIPKQPTLMSSNLDTSAFSTFLCFFTSLRSFVVLCCSLLSFTLALIYFSMPQIHSLSILTLFLN